MPRRSASRVIQFGTLRLRLIKIAARVVELKTLVENHLPTSAPDQPSFGLVLERLPLRSLEARRSVSRRAFSPQPPAPTQVTNLNPLRRERTRAPRSSICDLTYQVYCNEAQAENEATRVSSFHESIAQKADEFLPGQTLAVFHHHLAGSPGSDIRPPT
jgi:hypothetical protein